MKKSFFILYIFLALNIPACQVPQKRSVRGAEDYPYDKISFNTRQARRDIDKFLYDRTASNGLVASFMNTATCAFSMETGRFHDCVYGKMGYLDEQAFIYDLALAVIGFLLNGHKKNAEIIMDALEDEFYLSKNASYGLYNSYLITSGIPIEDLHLGIDGNRVHAGPTLWVAIAALNHMKLVRNTRYLPFALDIVSWCRNELTYYRFPDGERGAVSMGLGWGPEWSKIFSTEHNVDYFIVLQMLRDIYDSSGEDVHKVFLNKNITKDFLEDEMEHIGRWLSEVVFNKEKYCFMAGVNQYGIDDLRILDGTSWGLGGIGPENLEKWGIDLEKLITYTEQRFMASYTLPSGMIIYGFDFTDTDGYEGSRYPLVWFEGTGQLIIAYKELAKYYARKGDFEKEKMYTHKAFRYLEYMYAFTEFYDLGGGLPYMSIRPGKKQIVKTLKWEWEIPRGKDETTWVCALSSTMWYLYCLHDFYNPMKWSMD
ncbi:MAG: hypothetical protein JW928_07160 [Candidatus Aureabacteria bacterium]|nr:hypothetical protein [Candidatus Auribacterota bacterium]